MAITRYMTLVCPHGKVRGTAIHTEDGRSIADAFTSLKESGFVGTIDSRDSREDIQSCAECRGVAKRLTKRLTSEDILELRPSQDAKYALALMSAGIGSSGRLKTDLMDPEDDIRGIYLTVGDMRRMAAGITEIADWLESRGI